MASALLVGNGFTSNLISDYSNSNMMIGLHKKAHDIIVKADELFNPFRKKVVYLVCKDQLSFNSFLIRHIKHVLKNLAEGDIDIVFKKYFLDYGLIYETQYEQISSVETLLKIIHLFKNHFSEEAQSKVTDIANRIYFNKGDNGLLAVLPEIRPLISDWLSEYKWIFTTNYDCILDDACDEDNKVMHLHGGFYIQDRYHKSCQKLMPPNAYLVWGVSGEDKDYKIKGGPYVTSDGKLFVLKNGATYVVKSLLETYVDAIQSELIQEIDIFGFSGENDQHINRAISKNVNIKSVRYFCDPKDVDNEIRLLEIKKRFCLPENITLTLVSWDEVWKKLR